VINIDENRADLVLIANHRMLSSRSVGQGFADWAHTADIGELLAAEVERSRAAVRKELPGTEIRSVLMTGLGALDQWREPLSQRLGLPVAVIEAQQPFQGATVAAAAPFSPVVAGGLAGSDCSSVLNLNPAEMRVQVEHARRVRDLVVVSGLVVSGLALGAGHLSFQVFRQRQVSVQLDRAMGQVGPTAKRLQEQLRAAQLVEEVFADRRHVASALARVLAQTPAAMRLDGLTFERAKHELTVRGSTATNQDVLSYIRQLEQLEGVRGVELKHATRRAGPGGERTDFELIMRLPATARGGA
jgi:Tfp pilus assembly protein PilN